MNREAGRPRLWRRLLDGLRRLGSDLDTAHRRQVTDVTAYELRELENAFALLVLGSFAGVPAPPSFLAVELLPHLQHEMDVLMSRARDASDALAEMVGVLDID